MFRVFAKLAVVVGLVVSSQLAAQVYGVPANFKNPHLGGMLAVGAGAEGRLHVDTYLGTTAWGSTMKGIHLGGIGSLKKEDNSPYGYKLNRAPGEYQDRLSQSGFQIGGFVDVGRGFIVAGAEHLTTKVRTIQVAPDQTWKVDGSRSSISGTGAYVKVGYHFGKSWFVFAGYGTKSGAQAGIGFRF